MNILIIGGTRFFGIPMIHQLLEDGHHVTIATRGRAQDDFGDSVSRLIMDRLDAESIKSTLSGLHFDVVIDKIAYCSNDIKNLLDVIDCDKYIYMSTTAVYHPLHVDTREEEFNGAEEKLVWCDRQDFPYDEVKRQAECALCQVYPDRKWIAVRYPFVIGKDDYTNRLRFYVEHVIKEIPMYIDNLNCQLGYIGSEEAGKFMAFLADKEVTGAINGCSSGTISLCEIIDYVEKKTGTKAIIDKEGENAPYNEAFDYSVNTEKAQKLGFRFTNLRDWIFELVDHYIELVGRET